MSKSKPKRTMNSRTDFEQCAEKLRAVGDPERLRIIQALPRSAEECHPDRRRAGAGNPQRFASSVGPSPLRNGADDESAGGLSSIGSIPAWFRTRTSKWILAVAGWSCRKRDLADWEPGVSELSDAHQCLRVSLPNILAAVACVALKRSLECWNLLIPRSILAGLLL